MPSKRKTEARRKRAALKAQKEKSMDKPSGESNYGRKHKYLVREGGRGTDYPEPKPWKS